MRSHGPGRKPSLQRTLLALIGVALVAGLVPAGVVLDRRLAQELESRAREDLAGAPSLLREHHAAVSEALGMYAREIANTPGLPAALVGGDRYGAMRMVEASSGAYWKEPVLLDGSDAVWTGQTGPMDALVAATRRGEVRVSVVCDGTLLRIVGLAPVERAGVWVGAAGVATPLDQSMAATLAGITRSDLVFLGKGGSLATTSALDQNGRSLAERMAAGPHDGQVREIEHEDRRYLATTALLGDATIVFVRDMQRELAVLPKLRRVAVASGFGALGVTLILGALLARLLARPVQLLADASDRLARGDFRAPLPTSSVREIDRVSSAFGLMRHSLAGRLEELEVANRELSERQACLKALQSELIQRERTAVSARLVAELAHEIRNPVANLRNCLELLHRRLDADREGQEFAALAINELLRMHELAERMLNLNRPRDPGIAHCDVQAVVQDVTALVRAGRSESELEIRVDVDPGSEADIPPDTLKQVLLNLVQNAREAKPGLLDMEIGAWREGHRIVIEVADNGPGIAQEVRDRIFEPFVTTKGTSGGIGLGLFLVDGTLRRYGGRIVLCGGGSGADVARRYDLGGACFRLELPAIPARAGEGAGYDADALLGAAAAPALERTA
jgi:two-component system, NtrC family, sensor kinase